MNELRPLTSDQDWYEYNKILLECFPGRNFSDFFKRKSRLVAYGIFKGPALVSAGARDGRQLHWIATHPDHRRQGHSRRVCEKLLEGVYDATVKINPSDPAAEALYRRLGFRLVTYGTWCFRPGPQAAAAP